jgi:hypothetical protein
VRVSHLGAVGSQRGSAYEPQAINSAASPQQADKDSASRDGEDSATSGVAGMSDWTDIEAEGDLIISRVANTAVYCNYRGGVVIRQEGEDNDAVVVIPLMFVGRVVAAIKRSAKAARHPDE